MFFTFLAAAKFNFETIFPQLQKKHIFKEFYVLWLLPVCTEVDGSKMLLLKKDKKYK